MSASRLDGRQPSQVLSSEMKNREKSIGAVEVNEEDAMMMMIVHRRTLEKQVTHKVRKLVKV